MTDEAGDLIPLLQDLALPGDGQVANDETGPFLRALADVSSHLDEATPATWGLLGELMRAAIDYE